MARKKIEKPKFKFHVKSGDTVEVIAGDEKGNRGTVTKVLRDKQRAIVEGLNIVTKHIKPTAQNPEGGVEKREAGIHISNLMVVDPKTSEPTRTGRKLNDKGKLKRFSKKTGNFID